MPVHDASRASTTEGLPIAPSLSPGLASVSVPQARANVDGRVILVSAIAIGVALVAAVLAQVLTRLIALITNVSFFGRWSQAPSSPADNTLGLLVIVVPVAGALIVGFMARWGSHAIRGHGIPEAMEQVLLKESRIAPRLMFLKPVSAAFAIGTGGPFGAEGPIIATGGALGSVVGQLLKITADERKVLLASGAAAGMSATFGSPVAAVLLAIELLLFEYRARSLIPVALAAASAAGARIAFVGTAPAFAVRDVAVPGGAALTGYVVVGALVGVASVGVTRLVYAIEDAFARLPIHWMWWPAIGGVAVGVCGYFAPHTLGVGYDNIENVVSGRVVGGALLFLCVMKFLSWSISLGSGTSGGTLAPLFTIGGAMGGLLGAEADRFFPAAHIDPGAAALVGMAAMFAGASRAPLASVVFAFETTRQTMGLLPLLGGCSAAYLVSCLMMRHSIMTEKIARRGVRVLSDYTVDYLTQILVRDAMSAPVITLLYARRVDETRRWIQEGGEWTDHQGFPVVDANGDLVGVVTRRDLWSEEEGERTVGELVTRGPIVVFEDHSLREAADHMVKERIGRVPVVRREAPRKVVGIVTRSDLLEAHERRLNEATNAQQHLDLRPRIVRGTKGGRRDRDRPTSLSTSDPRSS